MQKTRKILGGSLLALIVCGLLLSPVPTIGWVNTAIFLGSALFIAVAVYSAFWLLEG